MKLQHSGEVIEVDEVDLEKVGGPHTVVWQHLIS